MYYSIISREANERRFPGARRTYARLAEGTFTGGNVVVVSARLIMENAGLIRKMADARKSVLQLARLIGLRILLRAVIAQVLWAKAVNLALLEGTLGRVLGAKVKAVQTPFAEIGADVDDIEQLETVQSAMGGRTE